MLTKWATLIVLTVGLVPQAQASEDVAAGKALFMNRCAICHGTQVGQKKIGPTLAGIIGRKAGTLTGYSYSPAMVKFGKTWEAPLIDAYLTKPAVLIPGNKMPFPGLPNPAERANIVAYLKTL